MNSKRNIFSSHEKLLICRIESISKLKRTNLRSSVVVVVVDLGAGPDPPVVGTRPVAVLHCTTESR